MWLSDTAVKRPVLAIVISLLLIVFGLLTMERLALREFPDIDPPVVNIETSYPGASSITVENRITKILEERISGIEGIRFIESKSIDGLSTITIEFNINRNIDAAANDIRERISRVADDLPEGSDPPEIFQVDSNNDVIMWLNLTSPKLNTMQITDYADRYLVDQLSIVPGVARVRIGGAQRYAMRIWLDRKAMVAKKVTLTDIENALKANNIELPGGRIESKKRELSVWIKRKYTTPEDFEKLVIRKAEDGHLIRLKEVSKVEIGPENRRSELRGNRINMVGLGIIKQSRANTLAVANAVKEKVREMQSSLPKGMKIVDSYDTSVFIDAAIFEVFKTFLIALILVITVIFLFLGRLRTVIIPTITVPIALISSFIILYIMDYSLNLITLLALVLAIGLVVDDAIVVIENIVRRVNLGENPLLASYRGTRQVGFAVIATTLVLLAVFMPISLLEGKVGRLFTEFAFTISAAVAFSSLIALTLAPVMGAAIIKPVKKSKGLPLKIEKFVIRITENYTLKLKKFLTKKKLMLIIFITIIGSIGIFYKAIPEELVPQEDRGAFFVIVNGPEGASFDYMQGYMRKVEDVMMNLVDKGYATRALSIFPLGFGKADPVNSGIGIVVMKNWRDRWLPTVAAIGMSMPKLMSLPGVLAIPVQRQAITGGGVRQPVQIVIGNSNYKTLSKWRDIIIKEASKNPGLLNLDSDYKDTKPQLVVDINRDRAADLGVSIEQIGKTLETMLGARNITTYIDKDEEYDVILEANLKQKATKQDLNNIYVRSQTTNSLIPLANLLTVEETTSPNALNRFNRIKTITINASLAEGYTLGEAINYLNNIIEEKLPNTAKIDYKGQSRDFVESSQAVYFTFFMALVVMYLVLAAQFGSFVHPLVIFVTVPLAISGAMLGLWCVNGTLNIYSEIGIIMLVGLAAKNGILIIEFINQLRDEGMEFTKAIIEGAKIRLRPVLMTAISTVFGAVPLIIATGAGAKSRFSMGIVIFFGVSFATFFTLFMVPAFYAMLAKNTKTRNSRSLEVETLDKSKEQL